jgi:hypothetical protein
MSAFSKSLAARNVRGDVQNPKTEHDGGIAGPSGRARWPLILEVDDKS